MQYLLEVRVERLKKKLTLNVRIWTFYWPCVSTPANWYNNDRMKLQDFWTHSNNIYYGHYIYVKYWFPSIRNKVDQWPSWSPTIIKPFEWSIEMHPKYNSPALWLCCMDIKIYGLAEMNSTWYFGKISCKIKNSSLNMKMSVWESKECWS